LSSMQKVLYSSLKTSLVVLIRQRTDEGCGDSDMHPPFLMPTSEPPPFSFFSISFSFFLFL
jgi:hypothetical protein